ncbi:hypothetical protein DAT35_53895 [Vitiosangium sp. GDMCC 1.1324]|nr:hypothetical protein DAT35_53895 [Vitiosangium sp. GDMCC 1.1324]
MPAIVPVHSPPTFSRSRVREKSSSGSSSVTDTRSTPVDTSDGSTWLTNRAEPWVSAATGGSERQPETAHTSPTASKGSREKLFLCTHSPSKKPRAGRAWHLGAHPTRAFPQAGEQEASVALEAAARKEAMRERTPPHDGTTPLSDGSPEHVAFSHIQPSEQGQGRLASVSSLAQPAAVVARVAHSASHSRGRRWFRVMSREERHSA